MKYNLWCVVNAMGVPYHDTFRSTPERAWEVHSWRDVIKDGEHVNSCRMETLEKHRRDLVENGDRPVEVKIETQEIVSMDIIS